MTLTHFVSQTELSIFFFFSLNDSKKVGPTFTLSKRHPVQKLTLLKTQNSELVDHV